VLILEAAPLSRQLSDPVLEGLDDDKCAGQLGLAVGPQHPPQLLVRALQSGRTDAQPDDALMSSLFNSHRNLSRAGAEAG